MGFSNITRYELFQNVADTLGEFDEIIFIYDLKRVQTVFRDSALLIEGFENEINSDETSIEPDEFEERWASNLRKIEDSYFLQEVRNGFEKNLGKASGKKGRLTYKYYFSILLKNIANAQTRIIDDGFNIGQNYEADRPKMKQSFLSLCKMPCFQNGSRILFASCVGLYGDYHYYAYLGALKKEIYSPLA